MTREEIFKKYGKSKDNLLYIMHDVQDNNPRHYLSEEDLKEVANWLGLSYSYVHGVATFYSMYSLKPRGKYIIRVCESPTCHLMGSSDIILELVKHLGVGIGETTKDELCHTVSGIEHHRLIGKTHSELMLRQTQAFRHANITNLCLELLDKTFKSQFLCQNDTNGNGLTKHRHFHRFNRLGLSIVR